MRYPSKIGLSIICFFSFYCLQSQETSDLKSQILELVGKSDLYIYDDPARALTYSNEAYDLSLELNDDSVIAVTLNNLGRARWSLGAIEDALPVFQYSIEICQNNDYQALLAKNYGNMGNVYASANLFYDAIGYFKNEIAIQSELTNNKFRKFAINSNIGRAYQQLNVFDSSMHYFDHAMQYIDSSYVNLFSIFYFNIAEAHFRNGDIATADSILGPALENAELYSSRRGIIRINQLLAEIELKKESVETAFAYAMLANELAEESQKKELLLLTNRTLSKCYAAKEDYENAFKHEKLHEKYKEILHGNDATNELELLSYQQRNIQLKVLDEENQLSLEKANKRQKAIYFLILGLVISFFLIAMIIDRNRQIKAQSEELEGLNDFKNRLFAVISHDIRSPIQSVSMIVDMLDANKLTEEELRFLLPDVRKKTDRLNDLLTSLFQWAQGKLSEKTFNKVHFDLKAVICDLEEELADRFKDKKIALERNFDDAFDVYGDPGNIKIVIRNLLVNAIKFSWQNSTVKVAAHQTKKKTFIEVIDHGTGISELAIDGLFTMEIGSKDGTTGEKGSGLGLVLCQDFIRGQGGTIEVDSEVGKGSTFRIILPKEGA